MIQTSGDHSASATPDGSVGQSNNPVLLASGLTKSFAGNVVLRNVGFEARPGEIHALVGENGAGKSTLINLITGVHGPDSGQLLVLGNTYARLNPRQADSLGIATVHQELSLSPHLSVAENVHLGNPPTRRGLLDRPSMEATAQRLLLALGMDVDPSALVDELTLAEQQLVECAKAIIRRPRLLILDEATSALDSGQTAKVFSYLRQMRDAGTSILFVSHRMEEIFRLCDRITVLRNGEYVATVPAREVTTSKLVQMMIGRNVDETFPEKPELATVLAKPVVLSIRNLGAESKFQNVSFDLHQGEILGLGGLQGQGQHDLLESLFGLHKSTGSIELEGKSLSLANPIAAIRRRIAYVPEDRKTEGLIVSLSVKENLVLPSLPQISHGGLLTGGEDHLVQQLVERMEVKVHSTRQMLARLSGGNQQKVAIAKWLPLRPNLYLLAEPTRGIDVGTKQEIYRLMRSLTAAGASIILISSDTIELIGLSDRVLVMYERLPVALLAGDEVTERNVVHATVAGKMPDPEHAAPQNVVTSEPDDLHQAGSEHLPDQVMETTHAAWTRPPMQERFTAWPRAWRDVAPIYLITLLFALTYLFTVRDTFSLGTINNLSAYLFPLFLTALSQSVIMLTGGIDLSTGAIVSLATVILATRMDDNPMSMVLALLIVIAAGALIGIFTGGLVTFAKTPAIIVTLATSFLWSGLALYVLSSPGGHLPIRFAHGFKGRIGGVIPVTLIVLVLVLLVWKVIKNSPLGLHIYAVGDNAHGAFISGVNIHKARIAAYTIAGVFAMIGGVGLSAYIGTGDPLIGDSYTLASIAAAVLGGVSFFGGRGYLRGTIAGTLILGLLIQILFISGISPSWQRVVQGAVLIAALGIKVAASSRFKVGE